MTETTVNAKTPEVVGKPILMAGAEYEVETGGESGRNEFSNSAGHFRIVKSTAEMKEAGLKAAAHLSTVFTCEPKA